MMLCRDALPILWVFHPAIWWMQGTEVSRRNTPKTVGWAKVRLPCASCRKMEDTEPWPAHTACPQLPLVPVIASHCLLVLTSSWGLPGSMIASQGKPGWAPVGRAPLINSFMVSGQAELTGAGWAGQRWPRLSSLGAPSSVN